MTDPVPTAPPAFAASLDTALAEHLPGEPIFVPPAAYFAPHPRSPSARLSRS